ncbi:MAG: PIN domain-containing protein [Alcanivoracaceae bacterium]
MDDNARAGVVGARSDELADLRRVIDGIQGLAELIGTAAQVVLVIDANVVIRDLIWMASRRKCPDSVPGLLEASVAGSLVACVPPYALYEINDRIPFVAKKRGIDEGELHKVWEEYRPALTIKQPDAERVAKYRQGRDPKDADYLALAETISANGILSRDKDIAAMGGSVVSMEVVGLLRDYSRAAAVEFTIKINGCFTLIVGAAIVRAAFELLSGAVGKMRNLPGWIKGVLLCLSFIILANEKNRKRLGEVANAIRSSLEEFAPKAMELAMALNSEHDISKSKAQECLDKVLAMIELSDAD